MDFDLCEAVYEAAYENFFKIVGADFALRNFFTFEGWPPDYRLSLSWIRLGPRKIWPRPETHRENFLVVNPLT